MTNKRYQIAVKGNSKVSVTKILCEVCFDKRDTLPQIEHLDFTDMGETLHPCESVRHETDGLRRMDYERIYGPKKSNRSN